MSTWAPALHTSCPLLPTTAARQSKQRSAEEATHPLWRWPLGPHRRRPGVDSHQRRLAVLARQSLTAAGQPAAG